MIGNGKLATIEAGHRERGVGIVELMVAMTIGLVVIVALGGIFLTNTRTSRLQDDQSRLQETSLAALDVLAYHIRLAGFVDISDDPSRIMTLVNPTPANISWLQKTDPNHSQDMLGTFFGQSGPYAGIKALAGCDGLFNTPISIVRNWSCNTTSGPNSITVAYQVQPTAIGSTTVRTATTSLDTLAPYDPASGQGGDCGAQDVNGAAANPQGPLAINRFYVDTASNRLMCVGNGDPSKARPIAEGVEDMRIRYGMMPATLGAAQMDSFAGRYVNAADVPDWSQVLSVRVCLLVASPTANVANDITSYADCDGVAHTQSDGRIRKTSIATITLRNNVLTNPDALP